MQKAGDLAGSVILAGLVLIGANAIGLNIPLDICAKAGLIVAIGVFILLDAFRRAPRAEKVETIIAGLDDTVGTYRDIKTHVTTTYLRRK